MKGSLLGLIVCFLAVNVSAQEIRSVKVTELEKIISDSKKPVLFNFWATWCKPCLEEIPYFQEVVGGYSKDSVELVLVSVDYKEEYPKGLADVAKKRKFTAPIIWLNETNADYFCPRIDKNWSGACPATLLINNKTGYRKFIEGQITKDDLKKLVSEMIVQ